MAENTCLHCTHPDDGVADFLYAFGGCTAPRPEGPTMTPSAMNYAALRRQIWNAAVEACALVVQPIPHVDEERTCAEVADEIRKLVMAAPNRTARNSAKDAPGVKEDANG